MAAHEADEIYETYALALVLRDEGLHDAAIAHALEIDEDAVAPLLATAQATLTLLDQHAAPAAPAADQPS